MEPILPYKKYQPVYISQDMGKQPKCLLTDEWIKMWYMHIMEYHSAIKNEMMPFATTWIDLETMMHNERVSQKDKYHMI